MKRLPMIATLLVLGGGGYFGYRYYSAPPELKFIKASVTRGSIEANISATGTLSATLSVNVGSQVSGNVLQMLADFNTVVKKGQLIAVIDPATYQTAVDQAEASVRSNETQILSAAVAEKKADYDVSNAQLAITNQKAAVQRAQSQMADAKRKLDLAKGLFAQGIGTRDASDTAQANYDQAVLSVESAVAQQKTAEASLLSTQAQREVALTQKTTAASQVTNAKASLEAAQLNLERTKILAPVDGIVIARNMSPGQTVQASTTAPQLFEIAQDLSKIDVQVNIDESDISRVLEGQQATFTVDAYPGQTFRGEVLQVRHSPTNVQNVITYTVVIRVDNSDMRLFPGMTANTRIVTERLESTLRVPSSALRFRPPPQLTVVGDVGKGKGKGGGGDKTGDTKGDAPTGAVQPSATTTTAKVDASSAVTGLTAPQAADADKAPAADSGDGQTKRRGGRGGDGSGNGGFDRSKFQGKNGKAFDRSQFKGKDGKAFDRSQFQGKNGGGRNGGAAAANAGGASGFGVAGARGGGRGAGGRGLGANQSQTVYKLNAKNELEAIRIRTGISDGTWVALTSSNLEEGAELVTAVEGLPITTNANKQVPGFPGGNQGGFPGGGNNKGGGRGF